MRRSLTRMLTTIIVSITGCLLTPSFSQSQGGSFFATGGSTGAGGGGSGSGAATGLGGSATLSTWRAYQAKLSPPRLC